MNETLRNLIIGVTFIFVLGFFLLFEEKRAESEKEKLEIPSNEEIAIDSTKKAL